MLFYINVRASSIRGFLSSFLRGFISGLFAIFVRASLNKVALNSALVQISRTTLISVSRVIKRHVRDRIAFEVFLVPYARASLVFGLDAQLHLPRLFALAPRARVARYSQVSPRKGFGQSVQVLADR